MGRRLAAQTAHAPFGEQVEHAPSRKCQKMFVPARTCRKCKEMLQNASKKMLEKARKCKEMLEMQGNVRECKEMLENAKKCEKM